MIPPPSFLDDPRRKLPELQKYALDLCWRTFVTEVVG